jgi:FkbM family methyltransferase
MLLEIKRQFNNKELAKEDFINQMYARNNILFEYVKLLEGTDLKSIKITDKGVIFTSKEDGIEFFCIQNDKRTAPFEIMNFDTYESGDAKMIYELIQDGFNILDIGANIGWYSLCIAKKYPNTQVYSFEPIPNTFAQLSKNVKLNNFSNIKIHNFGFSDEDKELGFFVSKKTSVSSSAVNLTDDVDIEEVTCCVKSMDNYFKNNKTRIDFIKCDVEGAELFVFQGGIKTIEKYKPIVFAEMLRKWSSKFGYHPNDLINLFLTIKYECFFIKEGGYLEKIVEVNETTFETNFFFLHSEKHSDIIAKYAPR